MRWLALSCLVLGCSGDVCDDLHNRAFESEETLPCGATTCRWTIDFRTGRFGWSHDTVIDSGSYTCDGASITASRDQDGAALSGSYDAAAEVLTWEGQRYRPASP